MALLSRKTGGDDAPPADHDCGSYGSLGLCAATSDRRKAFSNDVVLGPAGRMPLLAVQGVKHGP